LARGTADIEVLADHLLEEDAPRHRLTLVAETDKVVTGTREDNLSEIVARYPTVRRIAPVLLDAFVFRAWKLDDPLLVALEALREFYATGQKNLPQRASTAFLKSAWRKLIGTGAAADRTTSELICLALIFSIPRGACRCHKSRITDC
jgi:hypothetical protein